jgi:RNA polymerase sigma factor (sigma-70 family)
VVAVPSIGRASQVIPRRAAPEADATRDLYERYARQIFVYCLHQLGNREEAEDATQSTFLNAFRGFKRGVDPEFESAWLYKIAQNVCLTRQRSSSRRRRIESSDDFDAMQDVLPAPTADSDELIGLPEALEAMPEQQRRALLLREWQGLSYKEIAAELELSQAAVETLLFRARRSLASGLTEQGPGKRVLGKLRAGGDAGSVLALLQGLFFSGGAKVAVVVATVAATSVVAATPQAREAVANVARHSSAPSVQASPRPAHAALPTPVPISIQPSVAKIASLASVGRAHAARTHAAPVAATHRHAPVPSAGTNTSGSGRGATPLPLPAPESPQPPLQPAATSAPVHAPTKRGPSRAASVHASVAAAKSDRHEVQLQRQADREEHSHQAPTPPGHVTLPASPDAVSPRAPANDHQAGKGHSQFTPAAAATTTPVALETTSTTAAPASVPPAGDTAGRADRHDQPEHPGLPK